ncbi:MAG: hypothetical protein IPO13_12085 [Rhodocyclaceae bacterium]|nr:hypothetical protein [Rhodocyclaceae bacterium]
MAAKFPTGTSRSRRAIELGWVPGFDEDTYANLGVDLKELIEIIETQKTVDKFASVSYVKALQLFLGTWEDLPKDVKDLSKARGIGKQLNANAKKLGEATDALVQATKPRCHNRVCQQLFRRLPVRFPC